MCSSQSATAPLQSAATGTAPHGSGATKSMCRFPGNRQKKLRMPTHARICRQLRQVRDIYHICNAHAHAKLALQLHPFHTWANAGWFIK
jgi:hypothetical protein